MVFDFKDLFWVKVEILGYNKVMYLGWLIIEYMYFGNLMCGDVKMIWYDGGKIFFVEVFWGFFVVGNGCLYNSGVLIIGIKGKLFFFGDYGGDGGNMGLMFDGEFI